MNKQTLPLLNLDSSIDKEIVNIINKLHNLLHTSVLEKIKQRIKIGVLENKNKCVFQVK